jgi:DNA-binding GntR family transcriptional regulator
VLSGEFPAGASISEASLARELGISRTPLREAIGQLVAEGFLKQISNRGTVVVEFTQRDVAELYDLREALEVYAVGQVAEKPLDPADRDHLSQLVDEVLVLRGELQQSGETRLNAGQMQRFVAIDLNYHTMLLRLAGNARLVKVVTDARVLLNVFALRRKGHDAALLAGIHRYHKGVLVAITRQNPDEARRLLGEHIRVSKNERLQEYEDLERDRAIEKVFSSLPKPLKVVTRT